MPTQDAFIEAEKVHRQRQEELGELTFVRLAHVDGTNQLAAIFLSAAGGISMNAFGLTNERNFQYLSERSKSEAATAINVMFNQMQKIIDGGATVNDFPLESDALKEATAEGERFKQRTQALKS